MINFYNDFLRIRPKLNIDNFANNPLILFKLAVNQLSNLKFLHINIFKSRIMIDNELIKRSTHLININLIILFDINLLESGILVNFVEIPNNIITIRLTNNKITINTFYEFTDLFTILFLEYENKYVSCGRFHS